MMHSNPFLTRYLNSRCAIAGVLVGVSALLAGAGNRSEEPTTRPVVDEKPIRAVADLDGAWWGEKDGVRVDLRFDSKVKPFQANWTVTYTVRPNPPAPQQPSHIEVRKGADLRCALSGKSGRANLFLPAYLGKDEPIKRSAYNGKSPVGEISQTGDGALRLRVIPTGYQDPQTSDYDFPDVRNMILHRLTKPSE
jgi:hypothetical protein